MWFLSASELSEWSAAGPGIGGASTAAGASPLEHLHQSEGGQRGEPAQASHNKVVGQGLAVGLRDSWCWGVATSRECGDNEVQGRCSLAALSGCVSLSYVGFAYLIKGQQKRQFHAAYLFQSQVPQPVWIKNMEYGLLPCWTEENFQRMSYLQQGIAEALLLAHFTARLEDLPPPVQILHVEWELPLSITQQYSPFSRAHGSSGELVPPGIVRGQFFQGVPAILGQSPSHTSLLPSALLGLCWLITVCISLFYYKCVHLLPFTVLVFSIQMARMEDSLEWLTTAKLPIIIYICSVIPKHKHFI